MLLFSGEIYRNPFRSLLALEVIAVGIVVDGVAGAFVHLPVGSQAIRFGADLIEVVGGLDFVFAEYAVPYTQLAHVALEVAVCVIGIAYVEAAGPSVMSPDAVFQFTGWR